LNQIDDQHYDCDDEQNVNESAERVRANQSKKPEHEQNHEDSPKHKGFLSIVLLPFVPGPAGALI
jgi:hypothetical protein